MHACEIVCVCSFVSLCETKWYETKRKATLPTAKEVQAAQQQQQRQRHSQKSEQARERASKESAEYNEYREREGERWVSERASKRPPVQTGRETQEREQRTTRQKGIERERVNERASARAGHK